MATHNWPGFGLASVSCSLDRPATVNRSSYTGVRSVATNPWHGKWSFKVQLATMQGDGAFQAARAFFTSLKGQVDNFHLPAVEAPQNANTGVTVSSSAAAGAVTLALTGLTTALLVGNMATVHGQLLSITGITTLSGSAQTITFEPPLRAAAPSTTAVETAKPYALVALSTSDFAWDIGQWRRYGLSFDCDEAIGDTDGASPAGDIWNATFTSGGGVVSSNDNIIVKQNGTALGSLFNTINFTGAVSVTSSGGGAEADVAISASGETIYLKDHGVVADGVTVNSAAAVEALIAAAPGTTQGCVIHFPAGHSLFDRRIMATGRPVFFRGYGPGTSTSYTDATSGSLVEFPAGQTGFRIYPTAQNSRVEEMRIIQTLLLSTSQLGSYTAGGTTITLNAAGDFANGQVVQLDGAGKDVALQGRLFTTTSGSPTITWTDTDGVYRGNSPGYIGMEISGTGIPAGATIATWGVGTMTISANATASNSGLLLTITTPIITEIVSGGGTTTLTIADIPDTTKTVTNRKISHAAPGIYSTIQCNTRNVEVFETQIGMCLHGISSGNNVADNGTFYSSYFRGSKFGVSLQGTDSQVNSFFGCNFAGPEIGVIDQSYLGNYFYGCHWAFNMGILVSSQGSYAQIVGGYFESGTSYIARGGGTPSYALAFGVVGLVPGYGWEGFASYNGNFTTRSLTMLGPITAKDDGTGSNIAGLFDGGFWSKGSRPAYFTGNMNGIPGVPGTLSGVALGNSGGGSGGVNVVASYDNISGGSTRELAIYASQFRIGNTYLGSQVGTWDTTNGIRWRYPIGYDNGGNGVGGTVTQATSKATGVTLNKVTGQITMNGAALAASTSASFTLTNSQIAATDTVIVNIGSGATASSYVVIVDAVAAGSCRIHLRNISAGSLSEALVLNFTVLKGANS